MLVRAFERGHLHESDARRLPKDGPDVAQYDQAEHPVAHHALLSGDAGDAENLR